MVDTKDLKSFGHCGCAGSSPALGTMPKIKPVKITVLTGFVFGLQIADAVEEQ